jgi:hypothetical protein
MIRDLFSRNVGLKVLALTLAVILWAIARFGIVR